MGSNRIRSNPEVRKEAKLNGYHRVCSGEKVRKKEERQESATTLSMRKERSKGSGVPFFIRRTYSKSGRRNRVACKNLRANPVFRKKMYRTRDLSPRRRPLRYQGAGTPAGDGEKKLYNRIEKNLRLISNTFRNERPQEGKVRKARTFFRAVAKIAMD